MPLGECRRRRRYAICLLRDLQVALQDPERRPHRGRSDKFAQRRDRLPCRTGPATGTASPRPGESRFLAKLFGFAQLDFAGTLPLADGRYLVRGDEAEGESVLVVKTLGAPPPQARRRRRARRAQSGAEPAPLALARATAVRAFAPFASEEEASRWLDQASEAEDTADALVDDGIGLLNRALHVQAVAGSEPHGHELTPERAVAVRIGYGDGEEVADGRFTDARQVDVWSSGASRRRRRQEDLRPQERVAAVLGGREHTNVCEILLLRARADLDAGRQRESALQLRVGLEALLVELQGAVADPAHGEDMATLSGRRAEAGAAANAALSNELTDVQAAQAQELLEICERVLRRRRVLRG